MCSCSRNCVIALGGTKCGFASPAAMAVPSAHSSGGVRRVSVRKPPSSTGWPSPGNASDESHGRPAQRPSTNWPEPEEFHPERQADRTAWLPAAPLTRGCVITELFYNEGTVPDSEMPGSYVHTWICREKHGYPCSHRTSQHTGGCHHPRKSPWAPS